MAAHELCLKPKVSEVARLIDWVETCCRAEGLAEDIRFKAILSLEEAVMNVVSHAFVGLSRPHLIMVRLDIGGEAFAAEVIDNGRPFDPTAAPEPDLSLPLEERRLGGLGIHLMRGLMDRVQYRRSDGNNILRLKKSRR